MHPQQRLPSTQNRVSKCSRGKSLTSSTMSQEEQPAIVAAREASEMLTKLSDGAFDGLSKAEPYGDFRDDLVRDGFAVVKGAIPPARANDYADKMYTYLEELSVPPVPRCEQC